MPTLPARSSAVVRIDCGGHRQCVLAARDALVAANVTLVPPIARALRQRIPAVFELGDLIAAGNFGLLRAATRYRPGQHDGTPFSAFARKRIRGAMLDSIRRSQWEHATRPAVPPIEGHDQNCGLPWLIDQELDRRLLGERLQAAIGSLPALQRRVIAAFYLEQAAEPTGPARGAGGRFEVRRQSATVGAALGLDEYRVERERAEAITELRRRLGAVS